MQMDFDKYKTIKNHVQLQEVELVSLACERLAGNNTEIQMNTERKIDVINEKTVEIFLRVNIDFESDAPFRMTVVYKGTCVSLVDINEETLKNYAFSIAVSLLLPYARECVASTMARMGLPVFNLPTIDILATLQGNESNQG